MHIDLVGHSHFEIGVVLLKENLILLTFLHIEIYNSSDLSVNKPLFPIG